MYFQRIPSPVKVIESPQAGMSSSIIADAVGGYMNDVLFRLLLIIVAGVVAYRVISKRRSSRKYKIRWKGIVDEELEHLKKVVPVEHYINLLALSRSEITRFCTSISCFFSAGEGGFP